MVNDYTFQLRPDVVSDDNDANAGEPRALGTCVFWLRAVRHQVDEMSTAVCTVCSVTALRTIGERHSRGSCVALGQRSLTKQEKCKITKRIHMLDIRHFSCRCSLKRNFVVFLAHFNQS